MAKEPALKQILRTAAAIERAERTITASASDVNRLGNQFLARPRCARDEHTGVPMGGDLVDEVPQPPHLGTLTDERPVEHSLSHHQHPLPLVSPIFLADNDAGVRRNISNLSLRS